MTGMCELVQELGMHYKMKPEALANNVVFTIGNCLLAVLLYLFLFFCICLHLCASL